MTESKAPAAAKQKKAKTEEEKLAQAVKSGKYCAQDIESRLEDKDAKKAIVKKCPDVFFVQAGFQIDPAKYATTRESDLPGQEFPHLRITGPKNLKIDPISD